MFNHGKCTAECKVPYQQKGARTWHYMGTSTELTAGDQTKYSGDATYQNVLLPCQQRTTYQLDLEDSNTITQWTTLKYL
jgi:hypothetical protein